MAAINGHINIVNRLLAIPEVAANAAARYNYALRLAAQNGHINVIGSVKTNT
ncbi:MAG: hypothetical protein HOI53_06655 [Francisellaceae bacterium]|nr:hypothetical protein [Francisellaceae bacterium]MBT6207690.1 hypothetical protein [Francisellaceae bacterium]MBT6539481.1 hypothetical protein [Francisellaceae bacterium]